MTKTIHLIYPFDLKKKTNPWSIGNNIYFSLSDKFNFKFYNWMSFEKIIPNKGDILIGHAHTNPLTVFRRSIDQNWAKKVLLQPYNEDIFQMSHLYNLIPKCDLFISVCGKYWFDRINNSPFKKWKKKMVHIDLGLDTKVYPFVKKKFNKKKNRKIIYIGNDYSYNNFAKNLKYLKDIFFKKGPEKFASAGNKKIFKEKYYGWLNFTQKSSLNIIKKYDFLIQVSKHDANPTIVLEAISWGLIPLITKGCGYSEFGKKIILPSSNILKLIKKIDYFQNVDQKYLKKIQSRNIKVLKTNFNWSKFQKKIIYYVLKKKIVNKIKINYTNKEMNYFKSNLKKSPNYFLKKEILFSVIKSNIKRIILKN